MEAAVLLDRRGALRDTGTDNHVVSDLLLYLDPGSGSLLLQALTGGVAAVGVVGKLYWRRLLRALGRSRNDSAGS
jgi:hypothetical protein